MPTNMTHSGALDHDDTHRLIHQIDEARSRAFEVRNVLQADADRQSGQPSRDLPQLVSLQEDELLKATLAAHKAAEEAATKLTVAHRNLMTLLGYQTRVNMPTYTSVG